MNRTQLTALTLSLAMLTVSVVGPTSADAALPAPMPLIAMLIGRDADSDYAEGIGLQRDRKFEKAIEKFTSSIKQRPEFATFFSRGECYAAINQHEKAIGDFTYVIDKKPKLADAYRFRGRSYTRLKQIDNALKDFEQALALRSGFLEVYIDRGAAYYEGKQFDKAIADYSTYLRNAKSPVPEAYNNRGLAYLAKYQADKREKKQQKADAQAALADFDQFMKLSKDPSQAYLSRGDAYLALEEFDKAIVDYTLYLASNQNDAYAYTARAAAYEEQKKTNEALADYRKALEVGKADLELVKVANEGVNRVLAKTDPKAAIAALSQRISTPPKPGDASPLGIRAQLYMDLKDYPNAIRDYDTLILLAEKAKGTPQAVPAESVQTALYNRAIANSNLSAYDKAVADFNAYLATSPKDPANAYTGIALAYLKQKKYPDAAAAYTKYIELKPDDIQAYRDRGAAYYNQQEWANAVMDLDKYTKARPDDKEAVDLLNDAKFNEAMKGSPEKAIAGLTDALATAPEGSRAKLYLNRGVLYAEKLNDPDRAIADFTKAIELDPKNAQALVNRGAVYAKKKDWANVIKDTTAALAIKPDYPEALLARADAYLTDKKNNEAIADYKQYLAGKPGDVGALKGLSAAYIAKKDYSNAVTIMSDYIATPAGKTDVEAMYNRGVAYIGIGKYAEGISDLTAYISSPDGKEKASAYYNRGIAYLKQDNFVQAAADSEASYSLKPDYNAAMQAGAAYVKEGDKFRDPEPTKAAELYAKAAEQYDKALAAGNAASDKEKAEAYRSKAVAITNQAKSLEKYELMRDAVAAYDEYLKIARPLNLPEVAAVEKEKAALEKKIKDELG